MEPKGTSKTEEVVLTYIGDVMNGVSDRDVSDLIDPFRYSSKEGKNVRRVERLSGYDRQEPEFELQSNILRSIKTSELYETNPAVAVDNSTLMVWKRTFYSIRLLSEVSQQDIRVNTIRQIQKHLLAVQSSNQGVGSNLESSIMLSISNYLGE